MAYDVNSVVIIGRLTREVESSFTGNNNALCKFSIANNQGKPDSPNSVSYFDIVTWGKTAEICGKYLNKGSQVVVTGRLQQDRFQDKAGQNRSRVVIVAQNVQFIGSKPDGQSQDNQFSSSSQQPQQQQSQPIEGNSITNPGFDEIVFDKPNGDDIPF